MLLGRIDLISYKSVLSITLVGGLLTTKKVIKSLWGPMDPNEII